MGDRALARRYARAFIEIAEESGSIDRLGAELAQVVSAVRSADDLLFDALKNPVFTLDERGRVLDEVMPRLGAGPVVANLLRLLLQNGRFGLLPLVQDEYRVDADERAGRVRVLVSTAEPMSPQLEAEVRSALSGVTGKTVELDTQVDPSLIGGIVARVGGKVYDASVKNRLDVLRATLLQSPVGEA
jgi:F-type H+-transporting ATPase subunit delta